MITAFSNTCNTKAQCHLFVLLQARRIASPRSVPKSSSTSGGMSTCQIGTGIALAAEGLGAFDLVCVLSFRGLRKRPRHLGVAG